MQKLKHTLDQLHTMANTKSLPGMARFGIQTSGGRAISTRRTSAAMPAATRSTKHPAPGRAIHSRRPFLLRKTFSCFANGRIIKLIYFVKEIK